MMGVSSGDIIFNVGEIPPKPKMIIVTSGTLTYMPLQKMGMTMKSEKGDHGRRASTRRSMMMPGNGLRGTTILETGSWIAEPVLWTHWMHRGILTASTDARMCLLDAQKFQDQVTGFDHDDFNPKVYAAGFVEGLNNADDLSDCALGLEIRALQKLEKHIDALAQAKVNATSGRRRRASFNSVGALGF